MLDQKRLNRFADKEYRDSYLETSVRSGVSYQIRALRAKDNLSQVEFAQSIGKPQSVVSRLEDTEHGKASVQSLIDIAKARNVGLVIRFVDYPTFFGAADRMAEQDLQPDTIYESIAKESMPMTPYVRESIRIKMGSMPDLGVSLRLQTGTDAVNRVEAVGANDLRETIYA